MSIKRLTDSIVQDYLDGNLDSASRAEVEVLFEQDENGRALCEQYGILHRALAEDEGFALPAGFAERVSAMAAGAEGRIGWSNWLTVFALVVAGALAVFTLDVFVDWQVLWSKFTGMPSMNDSLLHIRSIVVTPVEAFIARLNGGFAFLVAAGLILTIIKSLDVAVFRSRYKKLIP